MTKTKTHYPNALGNIPNDEDIQAFNSVMLPVLSTAHEAYSKNPDNRVVKKAYLELLDFYRMK